MTYPSVILADSPVGYWRLDDASGPTVTATVGNNLTATNSPTFGAAGLLTGDADTAMSFVGASVQRAEGSDTGLPTGNSAWSVEAWIKTSTATEMGVVDWGDSEAGTPNGVAMIVNNGVLAFDTSWRYREFAGASLKDNAVHHIVMTYDGTTMRGYTDGVASANTYTLGAMSLTLIGAVGMRIGRRPALNFTGTIDEVAIYATALSLTQVKAHYWGTLSTTASFAQAAATWAGTATSTDPVTGGGPSVGGLAYMGRLPERRRQEPVTDVVILPEPEPVLITASAAFSQRPATWAAAMTHNDDELVLEMLARA